MRSNPLLNPFALGLVLCSVACSGADDDENQPPGETAANWELVVDADWTLEAGTEGYTCARATIHDDIYIGGFRAIAPLGTHHTLLTVMPPGQGGTEPDETFECNAATIGVNMIFGAGVGTNELEFPEGVAVKLPAGSRLLLNLHLFNTSLEELGGLSGTEVKVIEPEDVVHEAEIILAGKISGLVVEPGVTTQTGSCSMSHDVNVFAVFPHMHQMGNHLKATAMPTEADPTVLVDAPYDFEDQLYYPVNPPLELLEGDPVEVECQYDNRTREAVSFGDSSLSEMCFVGLYRYPKRSDDGFICTSGGGTRPTLDGPPCAEVGAPGNEVGIGRHCTGTGNECTDGTFCLAEFTDGEYGNFCTTICSDDGACGAGASCAGDSQKACIPDECAAPTSSSSP